MHLLLKHDITIGDTEASALVEYDYQPREAPGINGDANYPGCDESIDVTSVFVTHPEAIAGDYLKLIVADHLDHLRTIGLEAARDKFREAA